MGRYYHPPHPETATAGCVQDGCPPSSQRAGEGIGADIHLRRENRSQTIDKVAQRIRLNRTKLRGCAGYPAPTMRAGPIPSRQAISSRTASPAGEDLFYLSVFITVSAQTYEELLWRKRQMTNMLKSMDMQVVSATSSRRLPFAQCCPFAGRPQVGEEIPAERAPVGGFHLPLLQFRDVGRQLGAAEVNRTTTPCAFVDLFTVGITRGHST